MVLRFSHRIGLTLLLTVLMTWAGQQVVRAEDMCGFCCQHTHCPPPLKHCVEGHPRICWKCGCPRPICNPCDQPNWGYYQTCWTPWPWPHNWSHCPVPPPAAMVAPAVPQPEMMQVGPHTLPGPRPLRPGL